MPKAIKELEDDSMSDSSIEMLTTKNKKTEKSTSKPVKEKKPYVLTDARKAQFEKARLIQKEKALQKKKENDELKQIEKEKQELLKLKQEKEKKAKIKEIKKIKKEIEVESSDSEEEEEEPPKKPVVEKKKKKKIVVHDDDDDGTEEETIIIKKKKNPKQKQPTKQNFPPGQTKPMIYYF